MDQNIQTSGRGNSDNFSCPNAPKKTKKSRAQYRAELEAKKIAELEAERAAELEAERAAGFGVEQEQQPRQKTIQRNVNRVTKRSLANDFTQGNAQGGPGEIGQNVPPAVVENIAEVNANQLAHMHYSIRKSNPVCQKLQESTTLPPTSTSAGSTTINPVVFFTGIFFAGTVCLVRDLYNKYR